MRRAVFRSAVLAALLMTAAGLGYASYASLSPRARPADVWEQAIATARRAEKTKAIVPAVQTRDQAIAIFDQLSRSGPPSARSRAAMIVGILNLRNAASHPDRKSLELAVAALQRAVRLDRANDDAAYDLELLLARSTAAGRPLSPGKPELKRKASSPGTARPGTGY